MTKDLAPRTLPRLSTRETIAVLVAAGGPLLAKGIMIRRPWVVALLQATGTERAGAAILQAVRAIRTRPGADAAAFSQLRRHPVARPCSPRARRDTRTVPERQHRKACDARPLRAKGLVDLARAGPWRTTRLQRSDAGMRLPHASIRRPLPAGDRRGDCVALRDRRSVGRIVLGCLQGLLVPDRTALRLRRPCGRRYAPDHDAEHIAEQRQLVVHGPGPGDPPRTISLAPAKRTPSAQPGTLAALAPSASAPGAAPEDQVAQWLFAFDAAGIATFRALAVLASNDALAMRAHGNIDPPFLRGCLLEAVRVWPTAPAVLRETDRDTVWDGAVMPAGTGVLIHVPFLHRDGQRLPFADAFVPDVWLNGEAADPASVPPGIWSCCLPRRHSRHCWHATHSKCRRGGRSTRTACLRHSIISRFGAAVRQD
jgi:hypothetical protein